MQQSHLHGTRSLWRRRWLIRLGEWSFAFYMIHILVMRATEQLTGPRPELETGPALALTTIVFTVSLSLAWALYRWVERPGRRWLLAIWRRPQARQPTTDRL
ncbi:acyltransferase family protein [Streptomyces chartreusis]|uniref:acyltransferase family protein n=1 Tax=Streptomyces chartreusis TaxID=1969 RepID=UPI0037F1E972